MSEQIFSFLDLFEDALWGYLGVPIFLFLGIYLTLKSNFYQIRNLPLIFKRFVGLMKVREHNERGVHPLKAFFASVGGCVGIGNIVGICTAVQIGGPGALFWIWITAIGGMMIKYSEVFLGLRYRVPNDVGGYNGGPMYFLPKAFKNNNWIAPVACILLCIYGVEVYQFAIVTESLVENFHFNQYAVIGILLALVLFAGAGGVRRVGNISGVIIPLFVIVYMGMSLYVLFHNLSVIPQVIGEVFVTAFTGTAAIGGFVGSTIMLAMSQGVRRACYTGDLGVGYASVIHSESNVKVPEEQASLAFIDILLDTFLICTTSVMLVLVTGIWHQPMSAGMMVQVALEQYFPYMNFFMPFFIFILGYSTINAYFCVGLKCAEFLSPRLGRPIYYAYASVALVLFSFIGTIQAQSVMTIANGLLLVINCWGIFRLRKEISFKLSELPETIPVVTTQ